MARQRKSRYIGNEWVEKPNPVTKSDLKRLRKRVREVFGAAGSVVVERGRGSIPSEVVVKVCGCDVGSAEMRHVAGDILDIVDAKKAVRDLRESLTWKRQEVRWAAQALRDAGKAVKEAEKALKSARDACL